MEFITNLVDQANNLVWNSGIEDKAHGIYYPPKNARFEGTGNPPLIVVVHGGPTGQVKASWSS